MKTHPIAMSLAALSLAATSLLLASGAPSASAATRARYGPYVTAAACEVDRRAVSGASGCYQLGPGAAGWYFNA